MGNLGWLFLDYVLRLGVGLFVGVWLARYLGPKQFGLLSYATAFVAMFGALANLGLEGIVVRDIVRDPSAKDEILGTVFVLNLAGGLVALGAAVAAISLLRPDDILTRCLVAILASGMIFRASNAIDSWFQSQLLSKFAVWTRNLALILIALVKIALILRQSPLIAFVWAGLAEIGLTSFGLVIAYRFTGNSLFSWRARICRAKALLAEGWPLIISGLMVTLYLRINQVMLGEMAGDEALGVFSAAVRLSEIWYFIPMIIASSVFPSLVKSKHLGEDVYHSRMQKYYDVSAILAYTLSVPASLLAPFLMSMLYGESYKGSETIFSIHIWGCLFVFIGVARFYFLLSEGLVKTSFACTFLGLASNIALNLILIPKYQGMGAAISSVCSYFLSDYLSSFIFRPLQQTGWMQTKALLSPFRILAFLKHY